jgi:hypothetical protein
VSSPGRVATAWHCTARPPDYAGEPALSAAPPPRPARSPHKHDGGPTRALIAAAGRRYQADTRQDAVAERIDTRYSGGPAERDNVADQRDDIADQRDRHILVRDQIADRRDAAADDRDTVAQRARIRRHVE